MFKPAVTVTVLCLWMAGASGTFTNRWVVEIEGGEHEAQRVARELGYTYKRSMGKYLPDHYVLIRDDHPEQSEIESVHHTRSLNERKEVRRADQQKIVQRSTRAEIPKKTDSPSGELLERDLRMKELIQRYKREMNRPKGFNGGYENNDEIGNHFMDHYVLVREVPRENAENSYTRSLKTTKEVRGEEQQKTLKRSTRAEVSSKTEDSRRKLFQRHLRTRNLVQRDANGETLLISDGDKSKKVRKVKSDFHFKIGKRFSSQQCDASVLSTFRGPTPHDISDSSKYSPYDEAFSDPLWTKQWYMQDYRRVEGPVLDHNVVPAFVMGFTGFGVTVAVLDNGVVSTNPDLKRNLRTDLGFDYCDDKPGADPPDKGPYTGAHGTKCAGVIGMEANNGVCGVGAAYDADIIGVRTLCPYLTEYSESMSLVHEVDKADIYSCSWGPADTGELLEYMNKYTKEAFDYGIKYGRNRKGAIYAFAAGNGKEKGDNCAADHMVNHIATIPIASADQKGRPTWYGERCSAIFATGYSGSYSNYEAVSTTYLMGEVCTKEFSGTSAATPLASSMIALALEANPHMTYRDVMHLIAETAEVAPLANNKDIWEQNQRGYWLSNDFGFGLLNARNMVDRAYNWINVPEQHTCHLEMEFPDENRPTFDKTHEYSTSFRTKACKGSSQEINYLEHVQVTVTIETKRRGDLAMLLASPSGYVSELLAPRPKDDDPDGLDGWTVKTVHMWGENPEGKWTLVIGCLGEECSGTVKEFTVTLYGTAKMPAHYASRRKYAAFRLPDGRTSEY